MIKIIMTFVLTIAVGAWTMSRANNHLPSLCDEWNVAEQSYSGRYQTFKWLLTEDTIINETKYVKVVKLNNYEGALREDDNANIYIVPTDSMHEYLLYAFNVQVGDTLHNLWLDKESNALWTISSAVITNISHTTPRIIDLELELENSQAIDTEDYSHFHWNASWIEEVGYSAGGPTRYEGCLGCTKLDPSIFILCAYKNSEQMYMSAYAETYGCEYNMQNNELVSTNQPSASKHLRDGMLLIEKNDKLYNAQGVEIK